jgi:hypothetical protein
MDLAYKLERAEQLEPSSEAIRLPTELIERAITRGAEHLASTQRADGSWTGPYGGPMFLLPMYVSSYYIAGRPIAEPRRQGMIDYLRNVQLRDGNVQLRDGSVGLHDEAEEGSIFTSTLAYVALRLLGLSEDDPDVARMRRWIHANGGALGCAPWGKMTLTLLNLHPYEGMYPLLPELWELPEQLPIHPGRLWCHCRQVYLPMAYLYGEKAQAPLDPLLSQLRDEIYGRPYASIDFAKHRDDLAPVDRFEPVKLPMKVVNRVLGVFERFHPPALRKRIQSKLLDHIRYEDQVTGFVRIGPVNAVLNTLVHHFASPGSETVEKSFEELDRYIYPDRGGLMMNGYNSTALWDTAFATQALLASPDVDRHQQTLDRAHDYIRDNQVLEDVPERGHYHRHASRGGWPFSDRKHGWPITDCTAEGLKCALSLEGEVEKPVPRGALGSCDGAAFYLAKPRGRLGHLRAAPGGHLARAAQSVAGLFAHHGGLSLRGVHIGVDSGARGGAASLSTSQRAHQGGDRARRALPARRAATRRQLRRQLGRLFYLRHLVWRVGLARRRRPQRRSGDSARLSLPARSPKRRWWLGRALQQLYRAPLRAGRKPPGQHLVGPDGALRRRARHQRSGAARRALFGKRTETRR